MTISQRRYISELTKDTYALILAGGKGSRLHELTEWRAKPAVYFGGIFRLIDFPLSNCINSGIRHVGIATQYKSHSLIRHVNRAWGHFKKELGESVEILPASQRKGEDWYCGTADAVYQNIDIIRKELPKYVMILSGDHVYKMDYGDMLAKHVETGADMTVCCIKTSVEEAAGSLGVLHVDAQNRVKGFQEKPAIPTEIPSEPGKVLASMGNYIFNREFLFEQLKKDSQCSHSGRDFGHDIIPSIIKDCHVLAFPFVDSDNKENAYWRDVGTIDSYWEANMGLLAPLPKLNMYDKHWPIMTYQEQLAPAKFVFNEEVRRGSAHDSTVANGCIVSGAKIEHSLLFSSVHVHSYSVVRDSVLLPNVEVGKNCQINRAIIDRGCIIPDNMTIGYNNKEDSFNGFRLSEKGIVLVTQEMIDALAVKTKQEEQLVRFTREPYEV
ncbi:glucose-1-phosphate adenylyltransferase [Colwellia echini]|uniref:Glucose-1-phosphate adenylyltransferase n=1 Tax=Colwellia echini TaxID=1982103 RepID=A0ABY3MW71_9GAMM|nr:glucose-1-phosphate adenylyltransferase [Colwellia echini]TYK65453.1 glucose-1-phosphate adenylyltransferase [Colwellia echini]